MLVLDTHALVWYTLAPELLSPRAAKLINKADVLGIPAIVFWEVAMLVRKQRLAMDTPVTQWAELVRMAPGVDVLPLDAEIAVAADALQMHPDAADRFIVATALKHKAPLLTKDALLSDLDIVKTVW